MTKVKQNPQKCKWMIEGICMKRTMCIAGQFDCPDYTLKEDNKMKEIEVKIINKSNNPDPAYETPQSAGMDLRAFIEEDIVLNPGEMKLIPTGIYIQLPEGYEAQVRSRSGLALKYGIRVFQSPGTIDADYRGEISVMIENANQGWLPFIIHNGDRIAQMIIAKHERATFIHVEKLVETERGNGGFGHTGIE